MADQRQPTDPPQPSAPEPPWERNLAARLVMIREKRGLTQTDVAKALRAQGFPFHQQTIQRIERGERPIRVNEAMALSSILATPMSELLKAVNPKADFLGAAKRHEIFTDGLSEEFEASILTWINRSLRRLVEYGEQIIDKEKTFDEQEPIGKIVAVMYAQSLKTFKMANDAFIRATELGTTWRSIDEHEESPMEVIRVMQNAVEALSSPLLDEFTDLKLELSKVQFSSLDSDSNLMSLLVNESQR